MTEIVPVITGRPRRFNVLITLPWRAGPDPSGPASIVTAIERAATLAPAGEVMVACTAAKTIVSMAATALDADSAGRVVEGIVREALGTEGMEAVKVNAVTV
jgi:hypothetical protein